MNIRSSNEKEKGLLYKRKESDIVVLTIEEEMDVSRGQPLPSGSMADDSGGDDHTADHNIGGYDNDVTNDSDEDSSAVFDSADDNPFADDHTVDDPTADDDTEVLSPGPKKQLSSREHGLWRVNEKLFKRWHTKTKRVNRLVQA
jgi:hypothetical protein